MTTLFGPPPRRQASRTSGKPTHLYRRHFHRKSMRRNRRDIVATQNLEALKPMQYEISIARNGRDGLCSQTGKIKINNLPAIPVPEQRRERITND